MPKRHTTCKDLEEVQVHPCRHDALFQNADLDALAASRRDHDALLDSEPDIALLRRNLWVVLLGLVDLPPEPVQVHQTRPILVTDSQALGPFGCNGTNRRLSLQQLPEQSIVPIADTQVELPVTTVPTSFEGSDPLDSERPASDPHDSVMVTPRRVVCSSLIRDMDARIKLADWHHTIGELLGIETQVQNAIVPETPRLEIIRLMVVPPRSV
mmetsp:Transcript_16563/g.42744  ORF Transcript_16563/g.42744 Transcript_16563/m.42744 type:complete len:212 (+) Transcript_16563:500-1135(+)